MSTALLFSFSDIGRNERILMHATNLSKEKKMKIYVCGFDRSNIPNEIANDKNIQFIYIFPFINAPIILNTLLWPIQFIFYLIQMIAVTINLPQLSIILITSNFYFSEICIGLLLSKINSKISDNIKAKKPFIIADILSFKWFESPTSKNIAKKMLSLTDMIITPTHSMQVILKIGGLQSFVIENIPDQSFKPNKKLKPNVCEILNIPLSSYLICVPIPTFDHDIFKCIEDSARGIKDCERNICFVIFGNGKSQSIFQKKVKNLNNSNESKNIKFAFFTFQYDIYPSILGACDIGIYFNENDNGTEIPLPILQMSGCCLPIISFQYGCVSEIIKNKQNGFIIENRSKLRALLHDIFIKKSIDISTLKCNHMEKWEQTSIWKTVFNKII